MPSCSWRASGLTILRAQRLSWMAAFPGASWASSLGRASKHISPAEDFLPLADVQDIRVTAALSLILGFTKIELLHLAAQRRLRNVELFSGATERAFRR